MTSNDHITWGLIIDVFDVLERHGHHRHDDQHTGQALGMIIDLTHVYEGRRDVPYGTCLQPVPAVPHADPGPTWP
jgi:hypothetical protein